MTIILVGHVKRMQGNRWPLKILEWLLPKKVKRGTKELSGLREKDSDCKKSTCRRGRS